MDSTALNASASLAAPRSQFRFTPANARLMAARAIEARRRNQANRETALAQSTVNPPLQPTEEPTHPQRRLTRVRKQLDLLDSHMMALLRPGLTPDGTPAPIDEQAVERTARASAALSQLEQQLDGRPLPGSFKPTGIKPRVNPITSSLPE